MKYQPLTVKPTRPAGLINRLAARSLLAVLVLLVSVAWSVPSFSQIIGTTQLNVERRGHTATLLEDGKVLIVGGDNQSGIVSQGEIFDPVAQTSSLAASAIIARTDHTATRLADGRVLIIGGRDQNGALASTEIYDPLTATFTAGPSTTTPRSGHTATVLSDGKIVIAGGDAGASAEIFNPATQSFSPVPGSMNSVRKFHSAILTASGQVLIVGGVDAQNTVLKTAEVYDPASQSFYLPPTDMQTPRAFATLKLLADGKVQIIGGDVELSMEVFDPTSGIFNAKALLPPNVDLLAATLSTQSRAAIFSPTISQDPLLQGVLTPEELMLLDRADQSITELPSRNQALVTGGINSTGQILSSATLVKSSSASVTTDKTDYAPGEIVTITGSGFQPNEQVNLSLHEFPEEYPDITLSAIANPQGSFVAAEFAPQIIDIGRTFTLTAVGQISGFTAQTAFTDALRITVRRDVPNAGTLNISSGASFTVQFAIENSNTNPNGGTPLSGTYILSFSPQLTLNGGGPTATGNFSNLSQGAPITLAWSFQAPAGPLSNLNIALSASITSPSCSGGPPTRCSHSDSYTVNVAGPINNSPNVPTSLAQFKSNGTTSIATGGATNETTVVLKGNVSDPDAADTVKLQVEVKPVGTAFNGTVTAESGLLANGSTASVTVSGLTPGTSYHWQARTVDNNGSTSSFVSFGANTEADTDFRVDTAAPQIDCTVPDQTIWYGADVTVPCTASDSGSGLADASDANFNLTTNVAAGTETANASTNSRQVCDQAGNCATAGPYSFKVDKKAPVQSACDSPDGVWHANNVTLQCTYNDGGSGPASQQISLTTNVSAGSETSNAVASANGGQACDTVGNCAASPADIAGNKIDRKAPQLQACDSPDGSWHADNVTLQCTYTDSGSGPASQQIGLSTNVAAGTETSNAVASANGSQACDAVGNCAASPADISGNKIDRKAPTNITFIGSINEGDSFYFGFVPAAPTCTATDGGSGLDSCLVSGYSNAVGSHTVTATAKDKVANQSTATLNYTVLAWTLYGFYRPVDMSSGALVWNTVKGGSTVPLKFEVFAGPTELTDTNVVSGFSATPVYCSSGTGDDIEVTATGGTSLRYDTTDGQFIFNWQTPKKAGTCYKVTMTTQDGSSLSAYFKLR